MRIPGVGFVAVAIIKRSKEWSWLVNGETRQRHLPGFQCQFGISPSHITNMSSFLRANTQATRFTPARVMIHYLLSGLTIFVALPGLVKTELV